MLVVLACVALLAACACRPADEAGDAPPVVTVTPDSNGDTVALSVGQTLLVALPGNPSTGYTWGEADRPEGLERVGEPSFEADSDAAGSGGVITLEYSVVSDGNGTLELWYARPWESVQPLAKFVLDVSIE